MNARAVAPVAAVRTTWWTTLPLAVAVAVGTWLRYHQWHDQVLIDDEWHLVHRLVLSTPREMFLDFGYSDYAIPLGLFYALLGNVMPLSESALRMPMLVAGVATLVVLPALVMRRTGLAVATVFAWLLAIAPLLVVYSRLARPYALVLLCIWVAVFAIVAFAARRDGGWILAAVAVAAGVLASWMHVAASMFVAATFAVAGGSALRAPPPERARRLLRLLGVALAFCVASTALILPPLLANPQAMALKSGVDAPGADTLLSAWFAWVGTTLPWVAAGALALAVTGFVTRLRAIPEARSIALGAALAFALVLVSRPASSQYGIVLARYLLPALPLALLALAAGLVEVAGMMVRGRPRMAAAMSVLAGAAACVALLAASPVREWWERPNRHALHMQYYFDFRAGRNPYGPHLDVIPDSVFWRALSRQAPGSLRVAVAPFYFESFNWNAPEWERESGQVVIPGFLSGLCVDWRWGEVPARSRFAFRNAVHIGDAQEMAARGIDLVVWQKPYRRGTDLMGEETQHCEAALRERFGAPWYEDDVMLAFGVNRRTPARAL